MKTESQLTLKAIFKSWWPLAASWILMGIETPFLTATIARLPFPEINLAAYGGIVLPISLIIESPIIMLLAASTALSKDWVSFTKIRSYMMVSGLVLTILHIILALTPLYYFMARNIIGVPEEVVEPARMGLIIMTPWTWSIAYRRFHQGVLIRFGYSKKISIGTLLRLITDITLLVLGYWIGSFQGIVVGTAAIVCGVMVEALYVSVVVKPVLKNDLKLATQAQQIITLGSFLDFYIPLATTSLLFLLAQPLISTALSRMPNSIDSLALWPVLSGLIFIFRSVGLAYNEVVVSLLDKPYSYHKLSTFTFLIAFFSTGLLLLTASTPLSRFWFKDISGLSPVLVQIAQTSLWFAIPLPALTVYQNWFQGIILYGQKTKSISISVIVYLVSSIMTLIAGVSWGKTSGIYIGIISIVISLLLQTIWLRSKIHPVIHKFNLIEKLSA